MKNLLEVFFLFIKVHYFPFLSCAWGWGYAWFEGNCFNENAHDRSLMFITNIEYLKLSKIM